MNLLDHLNQEQREAILHDTGPMLILAGAGSGKTRVITSRIVHLINERGVSSRSILALTFTNKAAREMKERVSSMMGKKTRHGLMISTFHAFGVYLLRKHIPLLGFREKFSIFNTPDKLQLLTDIISDLGLDAEVLPPESAAWKISAAKNALILPENSAEFFEDPDLAAVYALYQDTMRGFNIVDFDDLLLHAITLFRTYPDLAEKYSQRFGYIMVDEYQDTNTAQYELLSCLTVEHNNICVVGDDDQSIYAWRGADINNILNFEKDFPGTRVIRLEQNYRSTKTILAAANSLIAHNISRKGKKLWTAGESGSLIKVYFADDEQAEAQLVKERIMELLYQKKAAYRDIALVFRTNFQTRPFEEVLAAQGVPYTVVGGTRFYDRKEAKDVIAYLRFLANRNDEVALLRIINCPKRGIGAQTMQKIIHYADQHELSLYNAVEAVERIEGISEAIAWKVSEFHGIIEEFGKKIFAAKSMVPVIKELLQVIQYDEELLREAGNDAEKYQRSLQFVQGVINSVAMFEHDEDVEDHDLFHYLERIALMTQDDQDEKSGNTITLLTMHACKGLEFPYVFICGVEDGSIPHSRSVEEGGIAALEEERRLFYVAMTRAMKELCMSFAAGRYKYGEFIEGVPSRFLEEIDPACMDFEEGAEDDAGGEFSFDAIADRYLPPS